MQYYILNENKEVVAVDNALEWAKMFEENSRRVDWTAISEKDTEVSTVFLGLDHRFGGDEGELPVVFETMVFSGNPDLNGYQERYCTYDEAVKGHKTIVHFIKNNIPLQEERKTFKLHLNKV